MADKEFFTIAPRDNKYLDYLVNPIPLMIVWDNGINADFNMGVDTTYVGKGKWTFKNNAKNTISFKVDVLIPLDAQVTGGVNPEKYPFYYTDKNDDGNLESVDINKISDLLDYNMNITTVPGFLHQIIRLGLPLYVTSRSAVIRNGLYVIVGNKKREQKYDNFVIWELEFFEYKEYDVPVFKTQSKGVTTAIKKYKANLAKKKQNAKKKAVQSTTNKKKLSKCNYKQIKYSKTKKVSACVKYLQMELYKAKKLNKNQIDGWFGLKTKAALKSFQQTYKKKYKLKPTGVLDKKTFNVLISTSKNQKTGQIGKTIQIKQGSTKGIIK